MKPFSFIEGDDRGSVTRSRQRGRKQNGDSGNVCVVSTHRSPSSRKNDLRVIYTRVGRKTASAVSAAWWDGAWSGTKKSPVSTGLSL